VKEVAGVDHCVDFSFDRVVDHGREGVEEVLSSDRRVVLRVPPWVSPV